MPLIPATRPEKSINRTAASPIRAPPSPEATGVKSVAVTMFPLRSVLFQQGGSLTEPVLLADRHLPLVHVELDAWAGSPNPAISVPLRLALRNVSTGELERKIFVPTVFETARNVVLHDGRGDDVE